MKLLKSNYKTIIETENLIIKSITEDEINNNYLAWLNNRETNQYLDLRVKEQNIDDIYLYINSIRKKNGCDVFAIFHKVEDVHIGNMAINYNNPNGNACAAYGILISQNFTHLGLGVEANIAFTDFLFSFPEINKLEGNAVSNNKVSWKTMDRLGWVKEGIRRKCSKLYSGEIVDIYMYGILKSEWREQDNSLKKYILKNTTISFGD